MSPFGGYQTIETMAPKKPKISQDSCVGKGKKKKARRLMLARGGLVSRFHVVLIVCEIRLRSRQELSPG